MWRGNLDGVRGCSNRHHLDTSAENKSADNKLRQVKRRSSNDGTEDDDPSSTEHANFTAIPI